MNACKIYMGLVDARDGRFEAIQTNHHLLAHVTHLNCNNVISSIFATLFPKNQSVSLSKTELLGIERE